MRRRILFFLWLRHDLGAARRGRATRTKSTCTHRRSASGNADRLDPHQGASSGGPENLATSRTGTIEIDWRWGKTAETLPELAAGTVRSNPDVIVTGGTLLPQALENATSTIPIVMAIIGRSVAADVVERSRAASRKHVTGFSMLRGTGRKARLELSREIVPHVSSVAVLLNSKNHNQKSEYRESPECCSGNGAKPLPGGGINRKFGLEDAFAVMNKADVQALVVLTRSPSCSAKEETIVDLADKNRLPAMYFFKASPKRGRSAQSWPRRC